MNAPKLCPAVPRKRRLSGASPCRGCRARGRSSPDRRAPIERSVLWIRKRCSPPGLSAIGVGHQAVELRRPGCPAIRTGGCARAVARVCRGCAAAAARDRSSATPGRGDTSSCSQQVGAADDLVQRAHAQVRQPLPHFLGEQAEEILHPFRQAGEVLGAQALVLRGHAGGAVVQVADAQVLAAQHDHRRGAETETVRAQHRRLDHVQPGLEAAVGLQHGAVAQLVGDQRLVRFGHAQFPRHAGVADRAQRAGAGAAVVAGNGDQVRAGLHHARGNRADARMRHQLHRDQRGRIDLPQVEDQLGQVLDRIDVVVRRRRDQADARLGVAQPRDHLVDLVPGQLAAFAGLGALRDLDLQHFGVDQVFRGDAETSGGDLLDLAALVGAVARGIFAAFAGVAAPAQAVHGDGQRFVRFRRQRAQAESRRCRSGAAGRRRRPTSSSGVGVAPRFSCSRSRSAEGGRDVTSVGVLLPVAGSPLRVARCRAIDHVRVVHVVFAAMHVLEQAADFGVCSVVPGARVSCARFGVEPREADAADARRRIREAQFDHVRLQADDLEQLRAAIAGDGGRCPSSR